MASKLNLAALTLNPEEARSASEAIFSQVYSNPAIADGHFVATGIQMKKQIPIFGQFGLMGKVANGCTPNSNAGTIVASQKYWDPYLSQDRLIHCQADIDQLFKMWPRSKEALTTWENMDSALMAFLSERLVAAMVNNINRIAWFNDTAAEVIANGGVLTAGTDKTYFNTIDGLWKQIFAAVTAGTIPAAQKIEIAENAGATYAAQLALASTTGLDTLRGLYEALPAEAFDKGDLKFQISRSLYMNWKAFLEDKSLVFQLQTAEQGAAMDTYRGIPIVVRNDWDRNIRTYEDNAVTYNLPHRAVLTATTNIPIGTADEGSFGNFDAFYDKVTLSHYFDTAWYLDAKLLEETQIAVAY